MICTCGKKSYEFSGGWNLRALVALALGIAPNILGFLNAAGVLEGVPEIWQRIYDNAWFVGAIVSSVTYYLLMRNRVVGQAAVDGKDV